MDEVKNEDKEEAKNDTSVEALEENEFLRCQKEREEYLNGWKRAKAELINYKKDEAKRFETIAKFSNESLIRELLLVLDSFDLALSSLEKNGNVDKGIYLILSQLNDVMKQNGLEKVNVIIGEIFNPKYHEAIVSIDSDKPHGTIIEEIEKGYFLNGKLIKPARVKVSK
ncbi:MAG: nucleotide exchange factor GrpE [Patescibacteria group bacterium]